MFNEYEQPTSRLDIADQQRKRRQKANESMDWRSSNNNRDKYVHDFDSTFRMYRDIKARNIQTIEDNLPAEIQPITAGKAIEMGLSEKEWKRQDSIRTMKRNQYLSLNSKRTRQ